MLTEIFQRDWPGMIATSITFGLFGVGVYLVVDSRHAVQQNLIRSELIMVEVRSNRSELLRNREMIDALSMEIKGLRHETGSK